MFKLLVLSVLAILAGAALVFPTEDGAGAAWLTQARAAIGLDDADASPAPTYRYAVAERGDITASVAATGTLAPVAMVEVGTQVSGQIKEIYADFNEEVAAGERIALIDPVSFEIAVDQARADLDVARAVAESQRATVQRAEAALEISRFEYRAARANSEAARFQAEDAAAVARRKEALITATSRAERERSQAVYMAALAQLRSVEALEGARRASVEMVKAERAAAMEELANAEAAIRQREAALRHAQIALKRTVIRSPVDGIVVDRVIEVGQTVAAALDAPTLFTIAQDLRDMQVNASIDESEIGLIEPGQRVEFTVDAYRDRRFAGVVEQIRKSPLTIQNVVTYTVIVKTANPDLVLLPGMTANARFIIAEVHDVMIVPNAALRFTPPDAVASAAPGVWIEKGGSLREVQVDLGLTDGGRTEIRGEGIVEGLQLVTGIERSREKRSARRLLIGDF